MQLEDYLDFQGPDVIRIKGHRIGLEHIVERYWDGFSPEQIAQDFPGLSLEKIYAVIAYYLHNRAEIDAYIARTNAEHERRMREYDAQEPSPAMKRLRALQAQKVAEHQS
jgi:uncharacterized protein (DUF433 family)